MEKQKSIQFLQLPIQLDFIDISSREINKKIIMILRGGLGTELPPEISVEIFTM